MINNDKIPFEVWQIINELRSSGYESYLVGGAVRDLVLGKKPKDFDICTRAVPDDVKRIFNKVIDTGLKFNTVTVLFNDSAVEVSAFRTKTRDESLKETGIINLADGPEEDIKARDFTINGLLYDGEKIIDYVNGLDDLKKRVIRAIDKKSVFRDDPLRMMRAVRIGCQLDFCIEKETLELIAANAGLIQKTAWERIRDELSRILTSKFPSRGIRMLMQTGLLKYILPELVDCYRFDQRNPHHDKDVFDHILAVLDNTPNNLVVRWAALLHDIAKPKTFSVDEHGVGHFYYHNVKSQEMSREILIRLKFDRKTVDSVASLVREHMSKLKVLRPGTVRKLINRVGRSNIDHLIDLQIADEVGSAPPHSIEIFEELRENVRVILERNDPLTIHDLAVGGQDLIQLGFRTGPEIGRVLKKLLATVLAEPEKNTRKELLKIVTRFKNPAHDAGKY